MIKNTKTFIFCLLLGGLMTDCKQPEDSSNVDRVVFNHLHEMRLKGSVKALRQYVLHMNDRQQTDLLKRAVEIYFFNPEGYIISQSKQAFSFQGLSIEEIESRYNPASNEIILLYPPDSDGGTVSGMLDTTLQTITSQYSVDTVEKVINLIHSDSTSTCYHPTYTNSWEVFQRIDYLTPHDLIYYKYNQQGLPVEEIGSRNDFYKKEYTYNSQGQLCELRQYGLTSSYSVFAHSLLYMWKKTEYSKFNNHGDPTQCTEHFYESINGTIHSLNWEYTYEYDQKGNWVECIEFRDNRPFMKKVREIEYYL